MLRRCFGGAGAGVEAGVGASEDMGARADTDWGRGAGASAGARLNTSVCACFVCDHAYNKSEKNVEGA